MIIEFVHIGKNVSASVTLTCNKIRNTVLVVPQKLVQGISEILFLEDNNGEWHTDREFESRYPSTVSSIKSALFYDC